MTAPAPEKAAPIPAEVLALADEVMIGLLGKARREKDIAWVARAIMQDRADRASQEERIREDERLRFEGDLDRWMKTLGAGITGYQPEAYAFMDAACAELVRARDRIAALEAEASEGERLRSALRAIAHTFTENSHGGMKTLPASYYQEIARRALIHEAPAREGEAERLRENLRANFEAFATMYDDVNETIGGMPSLVGLLHLGPEMQHACSALAEAVRSYADQKDSVISSALQYVKGKYDPSDDYDFRVYEELRNASPQDREEQ